MGETAVVTVRPGKTLEERLGALAAGTRPSGSAIFDRLE
jgi:hypothetical protein